jgi:glyoxylase-like metal-dependent hydrolase (beta-lactamase superfamily II)
MLIERWTGPPVDTHTYLVIDQSTAEAWVIDAPLDTAKTVLERVAERGLNLTRVILTHGHFDHLMDIERYAEAGIAVTAHPGDRPLLEAPQPALFGLPYAMPTVHVAKEIEEGETLRLGRQEFEVWHVPGHSPGHIALVSRSEDLVLGGDLLFHQGFGRVDLPGADPRQMARSLARLLPLPDRTLVYPGHGPEVTLGRERTWLPDVIEDLERGQLS